MPPFKTGPTRRRLLAMSAVLGAASLLPGCARLLGQAAPPKLYKLDPVVTIPPAARAAPWQLVVQAPDIAGGLDTARIALSRPPFTLDYFAEAAWTDRVPVLVQSLVIDAFQGSGRMLAVGRETVGLRSDYVLRTDIRDFEAQYDAQGTRAPTVRVRILSALVRTADRSIVGQHAEDRPVAADGTGLDAIVGAFNMAVSQALGGIVGWALTLPVAARPVVPVPQDRAN